VDEPDKQFRFKKHQSFAGLRHRGPLRDALPRIEGAIRSLEKSSLNAAQKEVVKKACDELSGKASPAPFPPFVLHSNVVEEIDRLPDDLLPRYLWYRYRYEIYPQRRILDDFPPCLQLEPTSICNYRCVFCYQSDESFHGKTHSGSMPLSFFKEMVDQAQGRCEALTLASRGEPMLNPNIKEMLAYVRGKFLALKVNTNASLLDEAKCHALLQADINTLVFSADAAAEPAYSRLRVGGNLEKVLRNVERFCEIRAKQYSGSRTIVRVSGVKAEGTPEIEEMEKLWGGMVDQVAFVNQNPWHNTYERPVNDIVDPCSELWLRMFVWWDGVVNPCENDYKSTLSVGNAKERSLSELWRSEKYEELRERHATKRRSQCSPCRQCPVV
jgi:radical SAM protein with 4Fe4S-binding SPASM domain